MQKKRILPLTALVFLGILAISLRSCPSGSQESVAGNMASQTAVAADQQITRLVHHYLFEIETGPSDAKGLEKDLARVNREIAEGDFGMDRATLFLCRAEILFRLGRHQQAFLDFYQFRYDLGRPNHPCRELAEARLTEMLMTMGKGISQLDQDRIAQDIFSLVFQERHIPAEFNEKRMRYLLGALDILAQGSTKEEDKRTLLFLKAESLYRMNEYKRAYVAFYRLMIQLDNRNHPLFSEVEKRLAVISRKLKPVKKESVSTTRPVHAFLLAGLLFLALVLLLARDYIKSGWQSYGSEIVNPEHLITLDEMREQDGRCSAKTLEEYQDRHDRQPWDQFSRAEQEKYKFARLLATGHNMICQVNQKPPLAIAWPSKISFLNWIPTYFQYSAAAFLFILLWAIAAQFPSLCGPKDFLMLSLLFTFTVACLSSIKIMSRKTINALDELVSMLEPDHAEDSLGRLQSWVTDLFRSPRQLYFGLVVMVLVLFGLHMKNRLTLGFHFPNLDILFSLVLVLISSQMIWFLTGSLFLMHKLYSLKDLSINPLSPSKTLGLEKMISVIGTYNVLASVVSSLGCAIALYETWAAGDSPARGALWFLFIYPILVFYWIYPYVKLGSLVKGKKLNRMNFVKTKIALLFNDWKASEDHLLEVMEDNRLDPGAAEEAKETIETEKKAIEKKLEDMDRYYEIFKKIEQSPESYFDMNAVLELGKALGFPSLFAILTALFSMAYGG